MSAVIDFGACICTHDKPSANGQRVYLYANQREDDALGVRDARFARSVLERICGDSFIEGYPSEDEGYRHLWRITMQFSVRKGGKVNVQMDYHAFNGCPIELRREMMDIYYLVRHNLKT